MLVNLMPNFKERQVMTQQAEAVALLRSALQESDNALFHCNVQSNSLVRQRNRRALMNTANIDQPIKPFCADCGKRDTAGLIHTCTPVGDANGVAQRTSWQESLRISELPRVHEALENFSHDSTEDNAVGLICAVLYAAPQPTAPLGFKIVSTEATPEIIAAAAIAAWPTASLADIDMARKAAPLVLMQMDMGPGATVETIAMVLATMAPAYRAMIAAAPSPQETAKDKP